MKPESRTIIICSHGTDNKFGRRNTNVVKLYQAGAETVTVWGTGPRACSRLDISLIY